MTHANKKGFTLLEILLVIAAIGILAAIVIVAINPGRQLAQARNAERESAVSTISSAVAQYIIDTPGAFDTGTTLGALTVGEDYGIGTGTPADTACETNGVDLAAILVTNGNYVASIPADPQGDAACTEYTLTVETGNRITIAAPEAEEVNGTAPTISVTR